MRIFVLFALLLIAHVTQAQVTLRAKHVVVIGIDGLSPDGIRNANTPFINGLIKEGAHTFNAQAVLPTVSSPNWASMITGATPKEHGIKNNSWEPEKAAKKSFCGNAAGEIFPTIFRIIREQRPDAHIACLYDWGGFGRLVENNVCNAKKDTEGEDATIRDAGAYLLIHKPLFTFIHLDHVDHAGHEQGHGTAAYYRAVEKADSLIGVIILHLRQAGIYDDTVILITADHGGKGKGHGGKSPEERTIPWIISGPGIRAGAELKQPVNTYDTAPTLALLLSLKTPACWVGKPVSEALSATVR